MPNLSIVEATFLASLPSRRAIFRLGGWQQTKGPGSSGWQAFLKTFFSSTELARAQQKANQYPTRLELSIGSYRLPVVPLCFWDASYPQALSAIYDPPPVVFSWGSEWKDYDNYVSIVGTRSASFLCEPVANAFARQKKCEFEGIREKTDTNKNLCIVSGFAYGVDRLAHLAAISENLPNIAVLGSGLRHAAPKRNLDIVSKAFVKNLPFTFLSEFPPYEQARPGYFPRRNRIIAGLSSLLAILQAPARSGALITAQYALEEGRDVLAFDHPVFERASPGSNEGARKLLEQGAEKIVIPELEEKITERPKETFRPTPEQLEFWKSKTKGKKWLGDRYYLEC